MKIHPQYKKYCIVFLSAIIVGVIIYQSRNWFSSTYYHYVNYQTGKWRTAEEKKLINNVIKLDRFLNKLEKGLDLLKSNDEKKILLGIEILNELAKIETKIPGSNGMANSILGELYMSGKGSIQKDINKAIEYLNKALNFPYKFSTDELDEFSPDDLENINSELNARLAICYYEKGNAEESLAAAHQAAKLGKPQIWIHLAEGAALKKDFEFAKLCIDEGIKTKDPTVINYFIFVLAYGKMVDVKGAENTGGTIDYPKDIKRALALIDEFAYLNIEKIFLIAGALFTRHELGWLVDANKGLEYYQKAAELGSKEAFFEIGKLYHEGLIGITKDLKKGIEYLLKAAEKDEPTACYFVGMRLLNGNGGFPRDINKATYYLHKACDMNNMKALFFLGSYYLNGWHGLPKNEESGLELLNKAEKLGYIDASSILGMYWIYKKNYEKAAKHLEIAAPEGNSDIQFFLAHLYHFGLGVEQNTEKAMKLYNLSAAQGHKGAQRAISNLNESS